jgi:hypothetical protein
MLDARGQVRKDLYKPNGDVHLNTSGAKIASLRIRNMLEIMLPNLVQAPVPAPVVINAPPAVNVPLVANVVQAPAGVQQLVGQVQDLVIQHVAVVQPSIAMEVEENENEIFKRLFLKRFGRALPEPERSDVDDINMDLIDLTKEDDEMEVATSDVVQGAVVKIEPIEAAEAPEAPIDNRRHLSRLERLSKTLRKSVVIPEKEAPLAARDTIADTDSNMSKDTSVKPVGSVNAVESVTTVKTVEQTIAEIDDAIAASQKVIDEFDN